MGNQIVFTEEQTGSEAPAPEETPAGGETPAQETPAGEPSQDRPEWLPENFKTVEDYTKSYDEQRATITKLQQEIADGKKAAESKAADKESSEAGADKAEAGDPPGEVTEQDFDKYTSDFMENGELSQEARDEIKSKYGYPDFLIDQYLEGRQALAEKVNTTIDNAFGGTEAKDAMLAWAGENMEDAEVDTLNRQFASNDLNTVLFAIDALKGKYEAAEGKAPAKALTGKGGNPETGAYQSWAQVTADMSDPRYKSDPAYRAEVERKLAAFNG